MLQEIVWLQQYACRVVVTKDFLLKNAICTREATQEGKSSNDCRPNTDLIDHLGTRACEVSMWSHPTESARKQPYDDADVAIK